MRNAVIIWIAAAAAAVFTVCGAQAACVSGCGVSPAPSVAAAAPVPAAAPATEAQAQTDAGPFAMIAADLARAKAEAQAYAGQANLDPAFAQLAADRVRCYDVVVTYLPVEQADTGLPGKAGVIAAVEKGLEISPIVAQGIPPAIRAACASYAGQVGATVNGLLARFGIASALRIPTLP